MRFRSLMALAGPVFLALVLVGCGITGDNAPSPKVLAYALGQTYKTVQQGEITYLQVGHPPADIADKIDTANQKASALVTSVIQAAIDVDKPDPAAEAAGISASDVAAAKTSAFQQLLDLAKQAVENVKTALLE